MCGFGRAWCGGGKIAVPHHISYLFVGAKLYAVYVGQQGLAVVA